MSKLLQDEKEKTRILPYIALGDKYEKNLCLHLYPAGKVLSLTCMKQDAKDFKHSSPCPNKVSALMVSTGKRQILSTVAPIPLTSKQT